MGVEPAHAAVFDQYDGLLPLDGDEFMAGIKAFLRCFRTYDLPRAALASFTRPVYFALGAPSNQAEYGEIVPTQPLGPNRSIAASLTYWLGTKGSHCQSTLLASCHGASVPKQ